MNLNIGNYILTSIYLFTIIFLAAPVWLNAQFKDKVLLNQYIQSAKQYESALLYAEAADQWQKAADLAKSKDLEYEYMDVRISMAELMRKTRDFQVGLEILHALTGTDKFPKLEVRKLGRMAALYQENESTNELPDENMLDSVASFLQKALALAKTERLTTEKAGLLNELGFLYIKRKEYEKSVSQLLQASSNYEQAHDTLGYINSLLLLYRNYILLNQTNEKDSLANLLLDLTNQKNWDRIKVDLYDLLAFDASKTGDSTAHYKWKWLSETNRSNVLERINTNRMGTLRVLLDNEKYHLEAESSAQVAMEKEKKLEAEKGRRKALFVFIVILAISVLIIAFLLFRERGLKQSVKVANNNYQMLMVESNHRIKNNLQMVISMLEYTKRDTSEKDILNRMKGKIHTVSALHQYLTTHIHDQLVPAIEYFSDIIASYESISESGIKIKKSIAAISIGGERIVYFGLILNEMLANTLEHKPGPTRKAEINIRPEKEHYIFMYSDGPGREANSSQGIGSKLIIGLVERVGGTSFTFDHHKGTYQFKFHVQ